jgi:hypothetical protein
MLLCNGKWFKDQDCKIKLAQRYGAERVAGCGFRVKYKQVQRFRDLVIGYLGTGIRNQKLEIRDYNSKILF